MAARGTTVLFRTGLIPCRKESSMSRLACQLRMCSQRRSLTNVHRSMSCSYTELRRSSCTDTVHVPHRSPVLTHCHKCYSTDTLAGSSGRGSLVSKIKHAMGVTGKPRYPRVKMTLSGFKLFRSCADLIDYEEFFEVFDMPDTFNSWFLVMELHIWLCMVRLAAEGAEGKFVRNSMIETMWKDVQDRIKLIAVGQRYRRESIDSLSAHFHVSLYSYDEGLLLDDRVLAAAIWRVFLEKRDADPRSLDLLVKYIRQQVQYLDSLDSEVLLSHGDLTFLPLTDENGKKLVRKKQDEKRI